jgi:membrane protease YdiL (CAAX protease family)
LHPALQACLPSLLLYLLLFRLGGLRPVDVAWRRRDLLAGGLATLVLWVLSNALARAAIAGESASRGESAETPLQVAGNLLGQLLGNALWEETLYRGFFLVQFLLLLRARGFGPRRAAWLAALLSAFVFALPHFPNRILKDEYRVASDVVFDQLRLVLSGLFLAWVFLRTRNLWWAVGLHGLANAPTLLFEWGWEAAPKEAVAGMGLLMTLVWPWVFGRRARGPD